MAFSGARSGGPISPNLDGPSLDIGGRCWWSKQTLSTAAESIVAVITGNLELADVPGNVLLPARSTGLPRDSVVNVSQLLTLDRTFLTEHAGTLPTRLQGSVDEGLRLVLQL
jgi:mRNA interferase MazF